MTNIDLTKSQFFIRDLQKVREELDNINSVDFSIRRVGEAIDNFLLSPKEVNAEEVKSILIIAQQISRSYNKETASLTAMLERLLEELAHLTLSQSLTRIALLRKANFFYKLATEANVQDLMFQTLNNKDAMQIMQDYLEEMTGQKSDKEDVMKYIYTNYQGNITIGVTDLKPGDFIWYPGDLANMAWLVSKIVNKEQFSDFGSYYVYFHKTPYVDKAPTPMVYPGDKQLSIARKM